MTINDDQWTSMIINHHQWSSMIINQGMDFHNFFDISVFEEEEEDWSKLPFLYQSWEAPNFGPRRPFEVFKKRKTIRIEFPKFLAWFQTPQTKHKYTNTQIQIHNNANYTILKWSVLFSKTIHFDQPLTHCAFSVQCSAMDIIIITIIITITIIMTLWCSAMASISSSSSNQCLPNSSWAIPKCIDQNIIPRLIQCSLRNFLPSLPY